MLGWSSQRVVAFDLTKNAFALLGASLRANRAKLEEAYQDAILEVENDQDEAAINKAHQSLISPRERLENEISFLINSSPSNAKFILNILKTQKNTVHLNDKIGLDLVNLLAHFCAIGTVQQRLDHAFDLIESYAELENDQILETLNALRSISGFGTVEASQLRSALGKLRILHARAALDAILADPEGIDRIQLFARGLSNAHSGKRALQETLIKEYESRVAPDIDRAASKVRSILSAIKESPRNQKLITALSEELGSWGRLVRPLQIADSARSIDESHSKEIFREIRQLCLNLANDHGLYDRALAISQLAAQIFCELPDAARKLDEDLETLSALTAEQAKSALLTSLVQAVEEAERRHRDTGTALRGAGFSVDGASPVGEIFIAFVALLKSSREPELIGRASRRVRSLAIDLCNESNDNSAALALTIGLLRFRSSLPIDVIQMLETDCKTLQRNVDFDEVTQALKLGNLKKADELARRMLADADEETAATLRGVRANISKRQSHRIGQFIVWGFFAAICLAAAIGSNLPKTNSSYQPTANSTEEPVLDTGTADAASVVSAQNQPSMGASQAQIDSSPVFIPDKSVVVPEANQPGRDFSLPELRYCRRQKARLDIIQNEQMSNNQIDRFNAAVSDYNARCGRFRYLQSNMDLVDQEIAIDQATLQSEAQDIIGSDQ
jgi:hypothetical protein